MSRPAIATEQSLLQAGISAKRAELEAAHDKLTDEMDALQKLCKHPNAIRTYKSSFGNYDPSRDSEWYECICHDCGKHWSEDA